MANSLTAKVILELLLKDERLQKELKDVNKAMKDFSKSAQKATATVQREQTKLQKSFEGTTKSVKAASRSFIQLSRDMIRNGDALIRVGKGLSIFVAGPLLAASAAAVKFATDFEYAFAEVRTILSAAPADIDRLNQRLRDLSLEVPQSLQELTRGLYQTVSAGVTEATEAILVLEQAAKAAVAGVTDTFTAVDALTTVLNAYSLSSAEAERVSDVLFNTVRIGKVTFPELSHSLGKVVATAALARVEFEEIAGAIAILTKNGINADIAAISLNQALLAFINPSQQAAEAAERYGIELSAAALRSQGFVGALSQLNDLMVRMEEDGQDSVEAFGELATNIRALRAIASLAGQNYERFTEAVESNYDALGRTQEATDVIADTLRTKLVISLQTMQNSMIVFGESLAPIIEFFSQIIALSADLARSSGAVGTVLGAATVSVVALTTGLTFLVGMYYRTVGVIRTFAFNIWQKKQAVDAATASLALNAAAVDNVTRANTTAAAGLAGVMRQFGLFGIAAGGVIAALAAVAVGIGLLRRHQEHLRREQEQLRQDTITTTQTFKDAAARELEAAQQRADDMRILRRRMRELVTQQELLGETNVAIERRTAALRAQFAALVEDTEALTVETSSLEDMILRLSLEMDSAAESADGLAQEYDLMNQRLAGLQLSQLSDDIRSAEESVSGLTLQMYELVNGIPWADLIASVGGDNLFRGFSDASEQASSAIITLSQLGVAYEDIAKLIDGEVTPALRSLAGTNEAVDRNATLIEAILQRYQSVYLSSVDAYRDAQIEFTEANAAYLAGLGVVSDNELEALEMSRDLALQRLNAAQQDYSSVQDEIDIYNRLSRELNDLAEQDSRRVELLNILRGTASTAGAELVDEAERERLVYQRTQRALADFNRQLDRSILRSQGGLARLVASLQEVEAEITSLREDGQYELVGDAADPQANEDLANLLAQQVALERDIALERLTLEEDTAKRQSDISSDAFATLISVYGRTIDFLRANFSQRLDLIEKYEQQKLEIERQAAEAARYRELLSLRNDYYEADATQRLTIALQMNQRLYEIERARIELLRQDSQEAFSATARVSSEYVEGLTSAYETFAAARGYTEERTNEYIVQALTEHLSVVRASFGDEASAIASILENTIAEVRRDLEQSGNIDLLSIRALTPEVSIQDTLDILSREWDAYYDELKDLDRRYTEDRSVGEREFLQQRAALLSRLLSLDKQYNDARVSNFSQSSDAIKNLVQGTFDAISQQLAQTLVAGSADWSRAQYEYTLFSLQQEEDALRDSYRRREIAAEEYNLRLRLLAERRQAAIAQAEEANSSFIQRVWAGLRDEWARILGRLLSDYLSHLAFRRAAEESFRSEEVLRDLLSLETLSATEAARVAIATEAGAARVAVAETVETQITGLQAAAAAQRMSMHIETEAAITAATVEGAAARTSALSAEAAANNVVAGTSAKRGLFGGIAGIFSSVPFPFNIALAAAALAAMVAIFKQASSAKFAEGGRVRGPGTGTSDSIPAYLSNGEYVVNARSTSKFLPLLERLNNMGHYASGGIVGDELSMAALSSGYGVQRVASPVGVQTDALLKQLVTIMSAKEFSPQMTFKTETKVDSRGLYTIIRQEERFAKDRRL